MEFRVRSSPDLSPFGFPANVRRERVSWLTVAEPRSLVGMDLESNNDCEWILGSCASESSRFQRAWQMIHAVMAESFLIAPGRRSRPEVHGGLRHPFGQSSDPCWPRERNAGILRSVQASGYRLNEGKRFQGWACLQQPIMNWYKSGGSMKNNPYQTTATHLD